MPNINDHIGKIPILYKDQFLLALEKPTGLLTVPGRTETDCLIARVQAEASEVMIVHRLDRDTSGILLLARNADVHRQLSQLFELRQIQKTYQAIVVGTVSEDQTIRLPIRRDMSISLPPTYIVDEQRGRTTVTVLEIICDESSNTRVRLQPKTGRSHQLRVHCQAIGHPIVGDPIYGTAGNGRLMLHACGLSFRHPITNDRINIESRTPF